ncbi:S-adenosyl-L-methionine-dependent methyltransferase [Periconia macrospinosa]|uniref:S-adenosyl-L-methionine-dependent methyltransferase n=1 Tax=Periconia macrospinosa TaxID=97972 RepID=A0A2V1EC67_9PLEO|nr:S-adenosyl-L-methionine-dependent methyltransferase [Periconia macrospinosa]
MATKPFLDQVFATTSIEQSRQLYDQWAVSYDSDMAAHEFTGPRLVAERVAKYLRDVPASKAQIVDAGCGSGAVGLELKKLGYQAVDGLDISPGMLNVARKLAVYRELKIADLTKKLEVQDGAYDALVCCGMFTYGHLEKELLDDFTRVVRSGGILVATVLENYWNEKDFVGMVEKMTGSKTVEILEDDVHDYRKGAGGGRVLVLRKS